MRVVADTNTIVSALLWDGSPYRLIAAIDEYATTHLAGALKQFWPMRHICWHPCSAFLSFAVSHARIFLIVLLGKRDFHTAANRLTVSGY